jgi:hypothetical protein
MRPVEAEFFEPGEPTRVPTVGRLREGVTERVQPIFQVSEGLRLRDLFMYDAELDTECRHGDGFCLPATVGLGGEAAVGAYYSDQQCQSSMNLALVPKGACDPPLRFASDGADYYEIREPYTQPIFSSADDTCSSYVPPAPYVAYRVGAPIDRSVFARGTMVIDP